MAFGKPKWAKIGILGFAGSGKTWTAIDIAAWLHARIKCTRPLMIFDSEGGFDYQVDRIKKLTGHEPDGVQAQSFSDLITFTKTIRPGDISLMDSITHPWRELLNASFKAKGKGLPGIMAAKQEWEEQFTKWYLSSPCHAIICGRAGYEFDYEDIDGKKTLVKTNTKMKTEGELGFEPSLLIEMERRDREDSTVEHVAIVKKDRFSAIDGKTFANPRGDSFAPHLDRLDLGNMSPPSIDVENRTHVDRDGDAQFGAMMKERQIILEEIQDDLTTAYPSTGAADKKMKIELLRDSFGTSSWTALEKQYKSFDAATLRTGREKMKTLIEAAKAKESVSA